MIKNVENTLEKLFKFLKNNRVYNKELQTRYYKEIINPKKNTFDNLVAQLYNIANTQSQPKIDYLASFYKKIYANKNSVNTFKGFLDVIQPNKKIEYNYEGLFEGMKYQNGWGNKTAALFAKSIFHLHNNEYPSELKIWKDAPNKLELNDTFYLPVDAVIIAIFNHINKEIKWDFNKINKVIKKFYSGNDIEVWDDLWFWGFITQKGTGETRKMEWNINKYWNLRESDKSEKIIDEIKQKAEKFLKILNDKYSTNAQQSV